MWPPITRACAYLDKDEPESNLTFPPPHPPLWGTFSLMEKGKYVMPSPLGRGRRIAPGEGGDAELETFRCDFRATEAQFSSATELNLLAVRGFFLSILTPWSPLAEACRSTLKTVSA